MTATTSTRSQNNIGQYVNVLWRRKATVLMALLVALGGMLVVDTIRSPVYLSTAKVLFPGNGKGTPNPSLIATEEIELLKPSVRAAAQQILGQPLCALSAAPDPGTQLIVISGKASNPKFAARCVKDLIQGFNSITAAQALTKAINQAALLTLQINQNDAAIIQISGQLSHMSPKNILYLPLHAQFNSDEKQKSTFTHLDEAIASQLLTLSTTTKGSGVTTEVGASPSSSPISPKPTTDGLLAGLAGLAIGIALALLRESLDDKIRTRAELEEIAAGKPAIGLIPLISEWEDRKTPLLIAAEQPKSPPAEAFRALRTSLQFMSLEQPLKTLLVTSPAAADGKTTVCADLAYTIAAAGQEVILVGCDLRKPRIHEFFGVTNDVGFTSVLLGEVELDDAIQDVPGSPYLKILAAGPIPPNPSELLSGKRTEQILEALKRRCDLVILDSTPLLPVSDAAVLAAKADGVLLVAASGISTKRDTARGIEILRQVDAALVGVVLNRAPAADSYAYYRYGYGYGYGSGSNQRQVQVGTSVAAPVGTAEEQVATRESVSSVAATATDGDHNAPPDPSSPETLTD